MVSHPTKDQPLVFEESADVPAMVLSNARFMAAHHAHPEKIRVFLMARGMSSEDVDAFFRRYKLKPARLLKSYKRARQIRVVGVVVAAIGLFGGACYPGAWVVAPGIICAGVYMVWSGEIPAGTHDE
jgi:hypothetical protein